MEEKAWHNDLPDVGIKSAQSCNRWSPIEWEHLKEAGGCRAALGPHWHHSQIDHLDSLQ